MRAVDTESDGRVNHCEQLHLQRIQLASSHPLLRTGRDVCGENNDGVDENSEEEKKKNRKERGGEEGGLGEEKGREEKDDETVKYDTELNFKFEAYTRYVQHVQNSHLCSIMIPHLFLVFSILCWLNCLPCLSY